MVAERQAWTDQDRLQVLSLYCRLTFGQLHKRRPEVIELAERMGRSANSVAMKLTNYASLDPEVQALGKKGLTGASRQDRLLWQRFIADPEPVAKECEAAWAALEVNEPAEGARVENDADFTGQETTGLQKRRIGQPLFRKAVMIRYDTRCVITGLRHEDLLIASHIVPWQSQPESRLDPANGLCLNALHDRAFDKGLLAIDERDRIRISSELSAEGVVGHLKHQLQDLDGRPLRLKAEAFPDRGYLAWHYRECFRR
ncbi:HNH endonuclease [Halomonas sp. M4R1S46]|uniref:HNH endonuclease n=1 Tax=Halomonas sp. M4R1S46 TaxID=2982692 RepID=UPI0021E3E510|nr:HNH endonuclease [Halomonas sp. M4R1S46]UYG07104.1 HNH endonuclease [Halomonas sp. M4R1S46]